MALHRQSKTNGTFFQDIPKKEYVEYKKIVQKAARLKKELKECIDDLAPIRTKYIKYLRDNPYKDKKTELEKRVKELRQQIIQEIPDDMI